MARRTKDKPTARELEMQRSYAKRLTARARGRLTAGEVRDLATHLGPDLHWRWGGRTDWVAFRTPGGFARDYREAKAGHPSELRSFSLHCRDKFANYGPSVWPETIAERGYIGFCVARAILPTETRETLTLVA